MGKTGPRVGASLPTLVEDRVTRSKMAGWSHQEELTFTKSFDNDVRAEWFCKKFLVNHPFEVWTFSEELGTHVYYARFSNLLCAAQTVCYKGRTTILLVPNRNESLDFAMCMEMLTNREVKDLPVM